MQDAQPTFRAFLVSLGRLLGRPMLTQKSTIAKAVVASIALSASQGALIFLTGPVLSLLFRAKEKTIALRTILPLERFGLDQLSGVQVELSTLVLALPLALVAVSAVRGLSLYVFQVTQEFLALHATNDCRNRLFAALLESPFAEVSRRSPAEWMSIIMNDIIILQARIADLMRTFVRDLLLVVSGLVAIFLIDFRSSLLFLLGLAPIAWLMARITNHMGVLTNKSQIQLSRIAASVLDLRRRHGIIRAHRAETQEETRFHKILVEYFRLMCRIFPLRLSFAPVTEFAGICAISGFLFAFRDDLLAGGVNASFPIQFLAALALTIKPLKTVTEQIARLNETRGALSRTIEIFESVTRQQAPRSLAKSTPVSLPVRVSALEVRVGEILLVESSDITLEPGKAVAIVGPSGAGKSSLARCFVGLLPPSRWQSEASWDELVAATSFVSQKPFFFDDTLRANLVYGLDTEVGDDELERTLERLGLRALVESHPLGLHQPITAVRSNVSGGQLQRLVLARALLRGKSIYVLDEATSALDPLHEAQILTQLLEETHSQQKALLAITHRLQHLASFDEVWFVEDKRIALRGRHEELLTIPRYREFVSQESS